LAGLAELRPLLARLGNSVLIVGGLMTRIWVHARPDGGVPARATADVDLGIDKRALGLTGDSKLIEPMLEDAGFEKGLGDNAFKFTRELPEGEFEVDVMVPSGQSKEEPPIVEPGVPTIAVPGLMYAHIRGTCLVRVEFVDDASVVVFDLPLPRLDAAFVMKAALVAKGLRISQLSVDTADAIVLAALSLRDDEAHHALRMYSSRSDVKAALDFLRAMSSSTAASARRIERHFAEEEGVTGRGEWGARIAQALLRRVNA
jgi:hypothetical protein